MHNEKTIMVSKKMYQRIQWLCNTTYQTFFDYPAKYKSLSASVMILAYRTSVFPEKVFHLDKHDMTEVTQKFLDSAKEFAKKMDSILSAMEIGGFYHAVKMGLTENYDAVLTSYLDAHEAWKGHETAIMVQDLRNHISMLYDEYCEVSKVCNYG
jgi:hypothetical protein